MNITILLAIACGLIFFTLLAIMAIAVGMTRSQIREAFLKKFGDRRAIGPEEIKQTIDDLFKKI